MRTSWKPACAARRAASSRQVSCSSKAKPPPGGGHVGRVRHDEVERAQQRRIDALSQVAGQDLDALGQVEGRGVVAGERHGLGRDVGGQHACERVLVGERARDAAGARAEIGNEKGGGGGILANRCFT